MVILDPPLNFIHVSSKFHDNFSFFPVGDSVSDQLISNLASDIETEEHVESLGRALGVTQAAINRHMATNRLGGRVTCSGTRCMLFEWRQTMSPSDQHISLKSALLEAGLVCLAHRYLKDAGIPHGKYDCAPFVSINLPQFGTI